MTTTASIALPPLRQSSFEQMGCEHSYALVHIAGLKPPSTPPSARGVDVHSVLAKYVAHCAAKRIKADFAYMDQLRASVGQEAADILEICRDSISVDWMNFYAAEVHMGLDEEFNPTYSVDHDGNLVPFSDQLWDVESSRKPPAYAGILDVIYLYNGGKAAKIPDYKSHPRPFDPSTFQGKEYPLFLFLHMPELQEIEFVLHFVRYPNIYKPVKYLRSDVPAMKEECQRIRAHQDEIHEKVQSAIMRGETVNDANLRVHAGKQCAYCPAMLRHGLCPQAESGLNPFLSEIPEDWLKERLYLAERSKVINERMKAYVDGTGNSIQSKDANGKGYSFGPTPTTSTTYPLFQYSPATGLELTPMVEKILDWVTVMPEDGLPTKKGLPPWPARLRIGATELTSPLKAKMRADLHQWVQDTPGVKVEVDTIEMAIERDATLDDMTGEEWRDYSKRE